MILFATGAACGFVAGVLAALGYAVYQMLRDW